MRLKKRDIVFSVRDWLGKEMNFPSADQLIFEHIKSNDVLFVDVEQPPEGVRITTVDVGEMLKSIFPENLKQ